MTYHEFYRTRAEEALREAEAATLQNVRERCLRAHAAWAKMASRAGQVDKQRMETEARKAALRDATQEA